MKAKLDEAIRKLNKRFPNLAPGLHDRLMAKWMERRNKRFEKFNKKLRQ